MVVSPDLVMSGTRELTFSELGNDLCGVRSGASDMQASNE